MRSGETGAVVQSVRELPGPRGLPWLGSAPALLQPDFHRQLERWHDEHGDTYRVQVAGQAWLVSCEPEFMHEVLRARPERFRRVRVLEEVLSELGVTGVFSAEGAPWKPQRKLTMEALAPKHLRTFYLQLVERIERLVRRWGEAADRGDVLDLGDELRRFTLAVTTRLVFGYDLDTLHDARTDRVRAWIECILPGLDRRTGALWPTWRWVRLPQDRALESAVAGLRAWVLQRLEESRLELERTPRLREQPENFLQAMLSACDEQGRPFEDHVLVGNALTLMVAGEDTTANTMAWALHELVSAEPAWSALRREADQVLVGEALAPPDFDATQALRYAGAVALETLRLRPSAALLFFEPLADELVRGVRLPAGTPMVFCLRPPVTGAAVARAAEFLPERWLPGDDDAGLSVPAARSLPFGSGPRICPGRSLALLELRVLLACVARRFDVHRVGAPDEAHERFAFAMQARGVRVRLTRRAR